MKRLLCSLLAFLLCVPLLSLSASAATIPGQYDVVDLLESGFFDEDESTVITASSKTYSFRWDVTSSSSLYYVYVNIYAPERPIGVTLNGKTGILSYEGAFYQYRFSVSKVLSNVEFVVKYRTAVRRTVSIGYCVGTVSGQAIFESFDLKSKGYQVDQDWNLTENLSIPYLGRFFSSSVPSDLAYYFVVNQFELQFDFPISSADYATIHLVVPSGAGDIHDNSGRFPWATPPAFYLGKAGSHTYPLDIINVESWNDGTDTMGGMWRSCWHYVYTVDVSGYRLDQYQLYVPFTIYGVQDASNSSYYRFYFDVRTCCVGLNADDGGWWRNFTGWLSGLFGNLGTQINNEFVDLKNRLSGWFSNLEAAIGNAINPPDAESVPVDEFSDAAGTIDDFEGSQMDSVDANIGSVQSSVSVSGIAQSLSFVQRYANGVFSGLGDVALLFTFPLFLGIFFYLCSRVSNNTHHKKDGDSS